ncbi:TRAP transporter T-component [Modicisalibacter muralis]|uniref:TRAP transporter T-component n=1 Tax=Modicisalibacter muralis TaxID=119000 RepID=A0A1G9PPE5_9GAMM|nr:TRAP transporter TatT component family protein [Halomonas muralis]SDM00351.1 TRAP transporter T-component [Halomonas muralis]
MPIPRRLLQASVLGLALLLVVPNVLAQASELFSLKNRWEHVTTHNSPDDQVDTLKALAGEAEALSQQYPDNADVLTWQGIILASLASAEGGLGALGPAKEARAALERAIEIDPRGSNASAYVTLGALYARAPGWPIAFGDSETAEAMFQKALEIRPQGIDVNYYYASFLAEEGRTEQAIEHARRAVKGQVREGREDSDEARREDARALLESLE